MAMVPGNDRNRKEKRMAIYNDIEEKMRKLPLQDLLCLQKDL